MKDVIAKHFHENYYPDMELKDVRSGLDDPATLDTAVNHLHQTHYSDMPLEDFKASLPQDPSKNITTPVKDISDFNKKYKTNYNTLQEFTSALPDQKTKDFFDQIKKEEGPDIQAALLYLQMKHGNPSVTHETNPVPIWSGGEASYNSLDNKIYLHADKRKKDSKQLMHDYISELSHSQQNSAANGPGNEIQYLTKDIPDWASYIAKTIYHSIADPAPDKRDYGFKKFAKTPYEIPGDLEHDAHKIIEPQLKKEFEEESAKPRQHFTGDLNQEEPVVPPKNFKITDLRKTDAASGNAITDKNLLNGVADAALIKDIVSKARKKGIDPYTALAMAHQETGLVSGGDENPFHIDFKQHGIGKEDDTIDASLKVLADKMALGKRLGKKEESEIIQAWNGYGKVGKNTEGKQNSMYGIDVSKEPIDMNKNPVYGKRIIDVRENILKKNPDLVKFIESIK